MTDVLLEVKNLTTELGGEPGAVRAVDDVSFSIHKGETFALLGESGCGKSMTALSIMRLLPQPAGRITAGEILLHGHDILHLPEVEMRQIRGGKIGMIFQEPMTSLNPVLSIGRQIAEALQLHKGLTGKGLTDRIRELLDAVGIPDSARRMNEYPHQLSGGMKQRVMIAMALAGEPELLIADEPTTALDVTIQAQVLDLLQKLQQDTGMAMLLITHDLGVVANMVDRLGVMYAGQVVESAVRADFFSSPQHPYSQKLFESLPDMNKRDQALTQIPGTVPPLSERFTHCRFAERCDHVWEHCRHHIPGWINLTDECGVRCFLKDESVEQPVLSHQQQFTTAISGSEPGKALLKVQSLKMHFPVHKGVLRRVAGHVFAVDDVDLTIATGETLALVGESGCGKTTVGKAILQLLRPTSGKVDFEGTELTELKGEELRKRRSDFQIIFQDPFSSMNPRMRVGEIIEEGMVAQGVGGNASERQRLIADMLDKVGLRPEHVQRYPHEFSGGQRQRICVARALAVRPKLIICDEPTSALDVSVQAQILNLLKELQHEMSLAYLFITHNLSVVGYLADRVAVMYLGRVVEEGPVESVLKQPQHPYTKALISAVPQVDEASQREIIRLEGDLPSPINPPKGCHFHPRCPDVMDRCRDKYPEKTQPNGDHWVKCHLLG